MRETATTKDLAEVLGVHPTTINLWARQGIIPYTRLTRNTIRYCIPDVLKALRERNAGRSYGQPGDDVASLGNPITL